MNWNILVIYGKDPYIGETFMEDTLISLIAN